MGIIIETAQQGVELRFQTQPGVFSTGAIDRGPQAKLTTVERQTGDRKQELGCG